jgi:hypothetical protein
MSDYKSQRLPHETMITFANHSLQFISFGYQEQFILDVLSVHLIQPTVRTVERAFLLHFIYLDKSSYYLLVLSFPRKGKTIKNRKN